MLSGCHYTTTITGCRLCLATLHSSASRPTLSAAAVVRLLLNRGTSFSFCCCSQLLRRLFFPFLFLLPPLPPNVLLSTNWPFCLPQLPPKTSPSANRSTAQPCSPSISRPSEWANVNVSVCLSVSLLLVAWPLANHWTHTHSFS